MRIGIDYRPALVNREGIGRYTRELVRALIAWNLGKDLGLFGYTLGARKYSDAQLGLQGSPAELVRLRWPSKWMPKLLGALGKGVDDLVGGAQVFHHTQPSSLMVRKAVQTATIFDCIYVGGDRAGYLDERTAQHMTARYKELVARCRTILVPTEFVGAEVVLTLGAHPAHVVVTPLGCDHVVRDGVPTKQPQAAQPYVLTVARVDGRKNHVRMLQAFELLVREGLPQRWIVAGPAGHGCQDFERALERSPARARVEWRRDVPDASLPQLYANADAFLFMSLSEGFGLPPLEAMACGAPVVSSALTSLPEVLGDAALLVEPTDVDQIFSSLRMLLQDRELALEMGRRGLARARRFTWQECAKKTLVSWRQACEPVQEAPRLRRSL